MLSFLRGKASDRKLRLFACACCRDIWGLLRQDIARECVALAQRHADDRAGRDGLRKARSKVSRAYAAATQDLRPAYDATRIQGEECFVSIRAIEAAGAAIKKDAFLAAYEACICAAQAVGTALARCAAPATFNSPETYLGDELEGCRQEYQRQSDSLCDIFGNPFQPKTIDSAWFMPNAVSLARTIYDHREYERMPDLANALEKLGFTDAAILSHCQGMEQHVRGCWVIDLLLGKS
jgi:hypothetical protein